MSRQNQILSVILAIQLVVLAIVFWPEPTVARGERLFGDLTVDQIVSVTVSDANNEQVRLARGPDGWGLPEADDFPVEEEKVRSLLDRIVQLRSDRLVTRTRDSHKQLQVADEDFARLIEFELQDGGRHRLYLGTSPRYQVLHVRADDDDEVYLALGLSAADAGTGAAAWIDTGYLSIPSAEIATIILENPNGRFEFEKDDADNWTMLNLPPGEELRQNNVQLLATQVSSLRMVRPLGREEEASYGLTDPSAVITVETRNAEGDEKVYIVRVGAALEGENGYVVKSATSPYYVLVAEYTVNDLLQRTLQDFLEQEPTPTPEGTPVP